MLKKMVALILALIMCASLCTFASADSTAQYDRYASLGDSVSCGFTADYMGHQEMWFDASEQAYCWKIGKDVGASDIYVGGFSAARIEELLGVLGGDVPRDEYTCEGGFYYELYNKMLERSDEVQDYVSKADLITMSIGGNDICAYAIECAGLTAEDFGENMDPAVLAAKIAKVVEFIYKGCSNIMEYYPRLLDRIYELNEDVELVVLSIYNPFQGATLLDETILPIGTAVSAMSSVVNAAIKVMAEERGAKYVDISSVETWYNSLESQPVGILSNAEEFLLYLHPTKIGYDYIYRQIREALAAEKEPLSTDITLDLNGIDPKGIYSVTVNGVEMKDYEVVDDYKLVIKYDGIQAVTATVKSSSGGKTQIYTWQLAFSLSDGYKSYAVSKTGDAEQYKTTISTKVSNAAANVKNGLKKLFGK